MLIFLLQLCCFSLSNDIHEFQPVYCMLTSATIYHAHTFSTWVSYTLYSLTGPTVLPSYVLSYCPNVPLSYCPTVLLSCCLTVPLSYCPTVLLSCCPTVLLSYCPTVLLSHCRIELLERIELLDSTFPLTTITLSCISPSHGSPKFICLTVHFP